MRLLTLFLMAVACFGQATENRAVTGYRDDSRLTWIPASGTYASRPGLPVVGQQYTMTDTQCNGTGSGPTPCRWNGSVWQSLGGAATSLTIDKQTGSSPYAIPTGDNGYLLTRAASAGVADTIAQAGSGGNFPAGWSITYQCAPTAMFMCSVTPTTSTIGGFSFLILFAGQSVRIVSDGTNYVVNWNPMMTTTVTPEQMGAAHDCSTNDRPAIQTAISFLGSGGTVNMASGPGCYVLDTTTLNITTSNVHIRGQGSGPDANTGTLIKTPTTTQTTISILGTSTSNCGAGTIFGDSIEDLRIVHTSPGTGIVGETIDINKTCDVVVRNVIIVDSFHSGVHIQNSNNNYIDDNWVEWGTAGGSCCKAGYYMDTTSGGNNGSTYMRYNIAVGLTGAALANTIGFLNQGTCIADMFLTHPETAWLDYGVYVSSTGESLGPFCRGDQHVKEPVIDTNSIAGITYLTATNNGFSGMEISGGFITLISNNSGGINLDGSYGSSVTGNQIRRSSGTGTYGIRVNGGGSHTIGNNNVSMVATGYTLIGTTGNKVDIGETTSNASFVSTTMVSVTGASTYNQISGVVNQYATTGVSLAAATSRNKVDVVCDPTHITTCITDASTNGNQVAMPPGVPTVDATSCTGAALVTGSTNSSGTLNTLPGSACTVKLTFANITASHGFNCAVSDQTTGNLFRKSAETTSSITFTGTSAASDVLSYGPCLPW
jgi:hypothetical protein